MRNNEAHKRCLAAPPPPQPSARLPGWPAKSPTRWRPLISQPASAMQRWLTGRLAAIGEPLLAPPVAAASAGARCVALAAGKEQRTVSSEHRAANIEQPEAPEAQISTRGGCNLQHLATNCSSRLQAGWLALCLLLIGACSQQATRSEQQVTSNKWQHWEPTGAN